jgi:radical SAM protein with 4Fe4S-binding SPASM domain
MPIDVAKAAVDYEFTHSDGYDEMEFDLFGGEPTLNWEVVRELVEWTTRQGYTKPFVFFLETNGTLVHGDIQKWLIDHTDHISAGLSLDGTPETHNRNRSNSYDQIDIGFFLLHYPEQSVRMTINNGTVGNLFQDVVHLHSLGFADVVATFAHGIVWEEDKVENNLKPELEKLCNYYLDHPEISECSIFDMHLPSVFRRRTTREHWCGTGTSITSYGVDGTRYPCHTFQSNTTSASRAVVLGEIDFGAVEDEFSDSECSSCILENVCPNCYGMNYAINGDILKREKGLCGIVKARALAVSYLRARQIEDNPERTRPNETYQTIAAIKAIQAELSAM